MTAAQQARRTARHAGREAERGARQVADHPALAVLARAGLVGFGILHLLLAWLAFRIAEGRPAGPGDQSGAFAHLAGQPLGRYLVGAIAVGLVAMVVWQVLEAAVGHRAAHGRRRAAERLVSAGRALVYGYLAASAGKVLAHAGGDSAAHHQSTSARLMAEGSGRALVVAAGVAVAAVGVGMAWYGVSRGFLRHLRTGRMSAGARRAATWLGVAGYSAKGAAYAGAGVLVVAAAVRYEPRQARGLDAALRTLAAQPYGGYLLGAVALGVAAYGCFSFVQARHRDV
ncbi:MAG TPA: DUF1206 domain-containing protein [Pilimelia sp.]|nr:DUF1206 domain-containing protein [Pilimelia sp.]